MITVFSIKKNIVLYLFPMMMMLTLMACILIVKNIWISIGITFVLIIILAVVGNLILRTNYSAMLEGKGMLALDINSTGIINSFLVSVKDNRILGKLRGEDVKATYLRENIKYFNPPVDLSKEDSVTFHEDENKKRYMVIVINEEKFLGSKFRTDGVPTFLYNSMTKTAITKEWFSDLEKDTYMENHMVYVLRQIEELAGDFHKAVRYIIELLRPKDGIAGLIKKYGWIVLVIGLLILGAMFAPKIMSYMSAKTTAATTGAPQTAPLIPKVG